VHHGAVRILAMSVFEGIVYHCACLDASDPGRPRLEVDALLRPGDADGPLLVPVADYKRMVGFDVAELHLPALASAGRVVQRDGVAYLRFPVWERVPAAD